MGESLNQPSRVREEGPRGCKLLLVGSKRGVVKSEVEVPYEKGPANTGRAPALYGKVGGLAGFVGVKGREGGP